MRCISCGIISFRILCKKCQEDIRPHVSKRKICDDFYSYSFFGYHEISAFLHTKHHPCGAYIYKILAQKSFIPFLQNLHVKPLHVIPIDDKPKGGYSHTAVLVKAIKSPSVKVHYDFIRSRSNVSYSGKSLKYRKTHSRNFTCKSSNLKNVILVDDLVTTGTTLQEAYECLKKSNINPLFALTLADAKVK